jgi:nucleoside-diphosphate-sugar epimerase
MRDRGLEGAVSPNVDRPGAAVQGAAGRPAPVGEPAAGGAVAGRGPNAPVLVTGATGFVGSHVVARLVERGVPVRALVRRTSDTARLDALGVERVEGSLTEPDSLRRAVEGAVAVAHLAALTSARSEAEYMRVNAQGTRAVLTAIGAVARGPRRFVYLSSLAAVGPAEPGRPVGPADTPRPLTAYGRSKLAGEAAVLEAADRLEVVVLRAPAVYGPGDRELVRFFRMAARGLLPVPTGPARPLQLVHVTDLAGAVVQALFMPGASGVVHVAEPAAYAWEDVARMVGAAVGGRARVVRVPAPLIGWAAAVSEGLARLGGGATIFNRDKARELLAPGWLCETDAARERLGFETRIALRDGLRDTAEWYRNEGWL